MKPAQQLTQLSAKIRDHLHQFDEIPLKDSESDSPCCGSDRGPTLWVSGRKDSRIMDLPKSGKANINYKVRNKSVRYNDDGSERYSTDIEVESIEPVELSAVVDRYTKPTEFSGRARDTAGRFTGGQDVSPNDMAAAYMSDRKKAQRKAALKVGAVGGLLAGSALVSPKAMTRMAGGAGRLMRRAVAS